MEGNMTAAEFLQKFLESYRERRERFTDEKWGEVWGSGWWNSFMMWRTGQPEPLGRSVLVLTAEKLGLRYAEEEPLTLDIVMYRGEQFERPHDPRLPATVALEHENDRRSAWREIEKLLSVRAPLKVLITYTQGAELPIDEDEGKRRLRMLHGVVREHKKRAEKIAGREEGAEYLIIVGHEGQTQSMWSYAMSFGSAQDPPEAGFQRVG
jgi:hypothetical protein